MIQPLTQQLSGDVTGRLVPAGVGDALASRGLWRRRRDYEEEEVGKHESRWIDSARATEDLDCGAAGCSRDGLRTGSAVWGRGQQLR